MTATDTGPAWARGFPLEQLRQVASLYREVDKPYALGAFSLVKENTVASWLADEELLAWTNEDHGYHPEAPLVAACRLVFPQRQLVIRDFTGEPRVTVPYGHVIVRNPAMRDDVGLAHLLEVLRGDVPITDLHRGKVWLEGWQENPQVRELAERAGLELHAVKIKASSELVGVYGPPEVAVNPTIHPADRVTLGRLALPPGIGLEEAAQEVAGMGGWADHYSSYNARHSWSALALRGFAAPGSEPTPADIVKPAEMSKAWKAEHPDWPEWALAWTPLLEELPAVRALVIDLGRALETKFERVRLMRLEPGGGELTRHSDITDPDAGTAEGKLARIHVPLVSNPDVRFEMWRPTGERVQAVMEPGTVWYLDTRKPHRAGNYGTAERIHLVADAYSSPRLRQVIAAASEAPEVAS